MAQARGHDVIYTAPKFSELQPIEMVWANVKGVVGRAYTTKTSFRDVYDRLNDAFYNLDSETIHRTIEKSSAYLLKLHDDLRAAEVTEASTGDDFDSSDSDSNDDDGDDEGDNFIGEDFETD